MPATRTRNMDSRIRAAFLDRDGVINIDSGYVCRRDEFVFVPGAVEACRILSRAGFKLFVVTNQSGIGRGYYTEEDFLRLTSWMQNEMASDGAPIEKVYFCPHHPDAKIERYRRVCRCRKPQPGMILDAIGEFGIDPARSVIFGDSPRGTWRPARQPESGRGFFSAPMEKRFLPPPLTRQPFSIIF